MKSPHLGKTANPNITQVGSDLNGGRPNAGRSALSGGGEIDEGLGTRRISRRGFVRRAALVAAPIVSASLALPQKGAELPGASGARARLKVVCVGGHPDDPESGCAGTLSRYADLGHQVVVIYLTRGERGISGKTLDESAKIRSAECEAACRIMGAKAVFAGQIDGATQVTQSSVEAMSRLLSAEAPDIVFTQWPMDTHMDHQVASLLTFRACLSLDRRPDLYYFEVNTGSQSLGFSPNYFVDVSPVLARKKAALLAHQSQGGDEIWHKHHELIAQFRGREAGVTAAEAFFHLNRQNPMSQLPGQ
jgi:LmbE family N-acetylglucosaminyl deacetylase